MAKIRDRLIRALGGHTEAEWQRDIASMRGSRMPVKLGLARRLPVGVAVTQTLGRPEDDTDPLVRENMAYRLGRLMMERGMIDYSVAPGKDGAPPVIRAAANVYPPEAEK